MISNAASEPHVQDLCRFLVSLGAKIDGIGSNVLHVTGVERLFGGSYSIAPGAHRGRELHRHGRRRPAATSRSTGSLPTTSGRCCRCSAGSASRSSSATTGCACRPNQELVVVDDLGGAIPKVEDGPWPAFPADLTSIAVIVATQAKGTVLVFEKMFESRLFFVDKLVSMGARIILCDPHRVVVTGPSKLYGQRMSSPDIRAGMAMVIAALCAEGTSTIGDAYQIDKGYERIDERLRALGAHIERVEG